MNVSSLDHELLGARTMAGLFSQSLPSRLARGGQRPIKEHVLNEVSLSTVWDDVPHKLQLLVKLEPHQQFWEMFYLTALDTSH